MNEKTYLYEWEKEDLENLTGIEKESFEKANGINDKLIDAKTLLEEITNDWEEYITFLEDKKISKYCEFKGDKTIPFNEELLKSIVTTLKHSLNDTNKAVNYNSKKIKINRVING